MITENTLKNSKESSPPFFGRIMRGLLNFKLKVAIVIMIALNATVITAQAQVLTWKTFPAEEDANVSYVGSPGGASTSAPTPGHVLKLDNLEFDAGNLPIAGGTLQLPFNTAYNTSRRILVWTDLSGNASEREDYSFATQDNIIAKKVEVSSLIASGDTNAEINISQNLLYDISTDTYATIIYVLITTDQGNDGGLTSAYTLPTNQRGGDARNNVNGVNLAKEFEIFEQITLSIPEPASRLSWKITPQGANVSTGGEGGHLLKLSKVKFDAENLPILGGTLDVIYLPIGGNSTRRISMWTDLSGDKPEIEDITFATEGNFESGKIATLGDIVVGTLSVSVPVPQALLYDGVNYATEIYLILHTNNTTDANIPGGNRGAAEFVRFDYIQLNIPEPSQFASHITITPGANASELNFAWFTVAGTANAAVLQLMPLTDDMQAFTGISTAGVHGFSTNKVTVTELTKNTEYKYRVGDGKEENWSKIYSFKTYDPEAKYSVIAMGDPQIGSSGDRGQWLKTVTAAVAQADKSSGAAFMLIAGDQTNYSNDIGELEGYLSPPELKKLPVAVTIGNHDVVDIRTGIDPDGFMDKVYNWPNHDDLKSTDADTSRLRAGGNYYFQYGNTLYISINSQVTDVKLHEGFMEKAIESYPDATWKIALFHHNIYGGGAHASPKGYADSYNMQVTWGPFLDKHGIDLVINGHDHVYARSRFMQDNEIMKYQMPTVLDIDETNATNPNPGTFIQPKGVQYMALSGATAKFYALEMQPWVAYGHEQDNKAQYSVMTVDGESLTFSTYRAEDDVLIDAITLKKTADYADLQSLIPGMKSVPRENITEVSWDAFQQKIEEAEAVTEISSPAGIHSMYITLYEAYYALDPSTDKTALGDLIDTVTEKLSVSSEGRWEGQYEFGSKAKVQKLLDAAVIVYDLRLATQANIDEAFADLDDIYNWFLSTESDIPCPFIYVHDIKAGEPYTLDLVDWMRADEVFFFGADDKEHYNAHFTKQIYAKDNADAMRSEERFGPVNIDGGRGHNQAHITKTHIGEWIRYELNVEEAGAYKATLGAANSTSSIQTVVLRDAKQNILSTFAIPANTPLVDGDWSNAGSIEGDKEFYLPVGKCIIELFFVNEGVGVDGSATANNYKAGADVDILILEHTGNMEAPVVEADPNYFQLPFIPTTTAGAVNRQRGWSTTGFECPESGFVGKDLPVSVLAKTAKLVVELAGPPSNSATRTVQVNVLVDRVDEDKPPMATTLNWSQAEPLLNGASGIFKPEIGAFGALVFDFEELVFTQGPNAFQYLKNTQKNARIIIGYYSYGWEELNVMKAYLITAEPWFVAVTDITHVPVETMLLETPLTLSSTVVPSNATYQTITWTVQNAGTTGATITDGVLSVTSEGIVTVRATITDGTATGTPYTQDFDITVYDAITPSITVVTATNPLHTWVNNGLLHITGLTAGELVSIYSASGTLVYRSIATGEQANIPLSVQGVYIVRAGARTVKVVYVD